ncbi:MAG: hypothetical protein WCS43_19090, partial [Verrucomicrobiota bacterium]
MINPKLIQQFIVKPGSGVDLKKYVTDWTETDNAKELGKDLMLVLGPTFAPVLGSSAKAAAIWFMMFNMFHGTL